MRLPTLGPPELSLVVWRAVGVWGLPHMPPIRLLSALVTPVRPEVVLLGRVSDRGAPVTVTAPTVVIEHV